MRGTVVVPIRDAHSVLKGYIGIESAMLTADFQTNVVPFKKRAWLRFENDKSVLMPSRIRLLRFHTRLRNTHLLAFT